MLSGHGRSIARAAGLLAGTAVSAGAVLAAAAVLALLLGVAGGSWGWAVVTLSLAAGWIAWLLYRRSALTAGDGRGPPAAGSAAADAAARTVAVDALLAALPDAALALDRQGVVLGSNAAARALFPSAPGRHVALAARAPELLEAIDGVLARGETRDFEIRLAPPHEQTLAARVAALGPPAESGPAALVLLRDVTEQERLARMRADFVANASHELRTPLASLKGFVETLQGAARDDPRAREQFLAIMNEQATRMSRLIDDLLSLSRIEMREHVPPTETADLAVIADEVAGALQPLADAAGINIERALAVRPALVIGDREELAQVIHNLVQNAIKYGRRGGKVEIGIVPAGRRLALSVADDGIGIAAEHLPRLTERFYRVSAKESRERGGTGLGLAIVKHIVNRHRGELSIASVPGEGSRFTVTLPADSTK